jgi:hypothetical protein
MRPDHQEKLDSIGFEWSDPLAHSQRVDKPPEPVQKRPGMGESSDDDADSFSHAESFGFDETLQETDSASEDGGSDVRRDSSENRAKVEPLSKKRR